MARRRQQTRLTLAARSDSVPDLTRAEDTYNRYMNERMGLLSHDTENEGRVYKGEGFQQRPAHVQTYVISHWLLQLVLSV